MEYALRAPPGDGVSSLGFSPVRGSLDLVVGSWDATVRLYDAGANSNKLTCMLSGACLSCCFGPDGAVAYAGGLDQGVYALDLLRGGSKTVIGGHSKPISCMQYSLFGKMLFTGGWDSAVHGWDERSSVAAVSLQSGQGIDGKVFSLSTEGTLVVVATSSKQILIYDTRNPAQPLQVRESPLRNQIRRVALAPGGGDLFVLASTEARVAVEYIDDQDPSTQKRNYAFKCHRSGNMAYPINAVVFHPIHRSSFATGGSDGVVNIWDAAMKKRICQLPGYSNSISSLAFSADGSRLAVAASYIFDEGQPRTDREDNILIRELAPEEVTLNK